MKEKELLSKLNSLKEIKPDSEWKRERRDILLSQISGGAQLFDDEIIKGNFFARVAHIFAQPVLVVSMIVVAVLGGGVFSLNAARDTKPGDSLYIAKIISEKAQLAMTFDEGEKAKLGVAFASNRAKEISQILESMDDESEKGERVEKLAINFKREISAVKTRLKKINEDDEVFSAYTGKEKNGVQVYNSDESEKAEAPKTEEVLVEEKNIVAVSPVANIASSTAVVIDRTLGEAEALFNSKDYGGTLNKLEEVINKIGDKTGEVKGVAESSDSITK